jgi:hypothetical protein
MHEACCVMHTCCYGWSQHVCALKNWRVCLLGLRLLIGSIMHSVTILKAKEVELEIPVEPLNDGSKPNVARGQKGFIGFVVSPLWGIWEDLTLAGKPEDATCEQMAWCSLCMCLIPIMCGLLEGCYQDSWSFVRNLCARGCYRALEGAAARIYARRWG